MTLLVIVLVVALAWGALAHFIFPQRFTLIEGLTQSGVATVLGAVILLCIYHKDLSDFAILNGQVTGKERVKVSCEHSYSCNCRETCSGTGNNRSCSTTCDTCYEHSYDVDWRVYTSVGDLEIDRINRQGTKEPPRWTAVLPGEPASLTDSYRNYLKASPASLFAMGEIEKDKVTYNGLFPGYPRVFDYYRYNRVIQMQTSYPQADELNRTLNMELRKLGAQKEVNIIVVFAKTTDPMYRFAFERHWLGGKKNDVIVIFGMDNDRKLSWSDVITFGKNSGNELLAVVLKDELRGLSERQQFGNAAMLSEVITKTVTTNFKRKQMKDFEYLKDDYQPSQGAIMGFVIFQIILLTGMTIFFYNFDLQRGDWHSRSTSSSLLRQLHVPRYTINRRRI